MAAKKIWWRKRGKENQPQRRQKMANWVHGGHGAFESRSRLDEEFLAFPPRKSPREFGHHGTKFHGVRLQKIATRRRRDQRRR